MNAQTFEEFRASVRELTPEQAQLELGYMAGDDCAAVLVYGAGVLERLESGAFYLLIGRDDWQGTQAELERVLFLNWSVCEIYDFSQSHAVEWLDMFCDWRGLPHQCAAELLHEQLQAPPHARDPSTRYNIEWLTWFCDAWGACDAN